jgi:hypothetical protein
MSVPLSLRVLLAYSTDYAGMFPRAVLVCSRHWKITRPSALLRCLDAARFRAERGTFQRRKRSAVPLRSQTSTPRLGAQAADRECR